MFKKKEQPLVSRKLQTFFSTKFPAATTTTKKSSIGPKQYIRL